MLVGMFGVADAANYVLLLVPQSPANGDAHGSNSIGGILQQPIRSTHGDDDGWCSPTVLCKCKCALGIHQSGPQAWSCLTNSMFRCIYVAVTHNITASSISSVQLS